MADVEPPIPPSPSDELAQCQRATKLEFCSEWNMQRVGTCYPVWEIDTYARQLAQSYGDEDCAREWACAAIATCYFSPNPRHWCRHVDGHMCHAAFRNCSRSHIPVPDFPPSLLPVPELPRDKSVPVYKERWVDPDTPSAARNKTVAGETLFLTFSDEFEDETRDLGPGRDPIWEAADVANPSDTSECFVPGAVALKEGRAVFTHALNTTFDRSNSHCSFQSAMLQGWNKRCFTGGYLEVRLRQPGTRYDSGLGASVRATGNLARHGYPASLEGTWPWSYAHCDGVAWSGADWGDGDPRPQKFRCGACAPPPDVRALGEGAPRPGAAAGPPEHCRSIPPAPGRHCQRSSNAS